MYYLMMQHEVADYDKWRATFDSMESLRHAIGAKSNLILRRVDNPKALTLIIGWDDLDKARSWINNPRLQEAMKEAGVSTPPIITFLTQS